MSKKLSVDRKTSTAHRLKHYDGDCSNVHGHNLAWEVNLLLEDPSPPDNMTVDFKTVSDYIDLVDHALLLNEEDELVDSVEEWRWLDGGRDFDTIGWTMYRSPALGDVLIYEGDPTCEVLAPWLAELLVSKIDSCFLAKVSLKETESYELSNAVYMEEDRAVVEGIHE